MTFHITPNADPAHAAHAERMNAQSLKPIKREVFRKAVCTAGGDSLLVQVWEHTHAPRSERWIVNSRTSDSFSDDEVFPSESDAMVAAWTRLGRSQGHCAPTSDPADLHTIHSLREDLAAICNVRDNYMRQWEEALEALHCVAREDAIQPTKTDGLDPCERPPLPHHFIAADFDAMQNAGIHPDKINACADAQYDERHAAQQRMPTDATITPTAAEANALRTQRDEALAALHRIASEIDAPTRPTDPPFFLVGCILATVARLSRHE